MRVLTLANRDKSMLDVETAPRVAAPGAQVGASVKAQPQVQASHPTDHGTVSDEERARMVRASHENAPQAEGFSPRAPQVGWEKRPRAQAAQPGCVSSVIPRSRHVNDCSTSIVSLPCRALSQRPQGHHQQHNSLHLRALAHAVRRSLTGRNTVPNRRWRR